MKTCPVSADSPAPSSSWLYLLERFDVGVVHFDRALRVLGMNDFARRSLQARCRSCNARRADAPVPAVPATGLEAAQRRQA
jgi:hypothetical protein